MSVLDPTKTTVGDLCTQALKEAGVLGRGQTPLAEEINDAWTRLQWLLQNWEMHRWAVFHLVTYIIPCVPSQITPYSVGPGGQFNLGLPGEFNSDFNTDFTVNSYGIIRPNQIESAFFQQNTTGGGNLSPIVYPLRLYRAMEDYRRISLPTLTTFPLAAFYDPAWPLGQLYIWPWPNNAQYSIGIVTREQLPQSFPSLTTPITLPYVYFEALTTNVAMALRPIFGIGTYPGDILPARAKSGLKTIKRGSTQIANIQMDPALVRTGNYNIYSDQTY